MPVLFLMGKILRFTIKKKIDTAAQSGLRDGFRGCRQRGKTSTSPVEPTWLFLETSLQTEEKLLEPPKLKGLEPKRATPFLTHVI